MKRPGEETLIRYFRGECSSEEENAVKIYLAMNIDEEYVADCLQEAFRDLEELHDHNISQASLDQAFARLTDKQQATTLRTRPRWYAYAAAVAAVILTGATFFILNNRLRNTPQAAIAWEHFSAGANHPQTYRLPDKSTVTLFPGSTIDVPENFNGSDRKIRLTGRAFFQVFHNAEKPFYVSTATLTTKVLGTSFEIISSKADGESIITLHTGKVSVHQADKEIAQLGPNQQVRYQQHTGKYDVATVQVARTLSWMNGELEYDQATLGSIVYDLEKWYGVNIRVESASLLSRKVSISIKDLPLKNVLTMLSKSTDFSFTMAGNQITLKERRLMNTE